MNSHVRGSNGSNGSNGKVGGGEVIEVMKVPRLKHLARQEGLRLNWPNADSGFVCAHCGDPLNQSFSILEEERGGKVRRMGCPARHTPHELAGKFRIVRDREDKLFGIIKTVLPCACFTSLEVPAPSSTSTFAGAGERRRKHRRRRKHGLATMRIS